MATRRLGRAVKARQRQPLAPPLDPSPLPGDPKEVAAPQESEASFRLALRQTPITLFRQDRDLRYTWRYSTDLCLSKVDCLGKRDRDLVPSDEAATLTRLKRRVLARGVREHAEVRVTVEGITHWYELTVTPTYDAQGALSGVAGTAIDITKRKQASAQGQWREALSRKMVRQQPREAEGRERLGEVVATVMHEFNNPLGVIMGFAQDLLQEVGVEDPRSRRLQIIESEAQRCTHLLRQLRDFTYPAQPALAWTDLPYVIRRSLALVASHLRQQQITPVVDLQPDLPLLHVDAQQLQQALLHLIFNALEAMPQKGQLTIQARVTDEPEAADGVDDPAVVITVADTGGGIASEDHEKIFQPFFTTKPQGGMGLGLAISQGIVHAHGGRLLVDSALGQGATFSIWLPVGERPPSRRRERAPS